MEKEYKMIKASKGQNHMDTKGKTMSMNNLHNSTNAHEQLTKGERERW